jgi:hypothetical protein
VEPTDASSFFDTDTWARLRQVKTLYDPSDLFKDNHHIPLQQAGHSLAVWRRCGADAGQPAPGAEL